MKLIGILLLASAALTAVVSPARAEGDASRDLSRASEFLSASGAMVAVGSLSALAASAHIVVAGVEASGEVATVVLKGASDSAEASLKLTGKAARNLSVATGTVVSVSVLSTGYLLVASGQVLAFVPNELGKALLHHSPAKA